MQSRIVETVVYCLTSFASNEFTYKCLAEQVKLCLLIESHRPEIIGNLSVVPLQYQADPNHDEKLWNLSSLNASCIQKTSSCMQNVLEMSRPHLEQ